MKILPRLLAATGLFLAVWGSDGEIRAATTQTLRVAATTTTKVSGILDLLHAAFEKIEGVRLRTIAVGTGKALRIARSGDADVLLVHAPDAEKKFVQDGYGINRRLVMYNHFVIVGPAADPAKIEGLKNGAEARKELALWQVADRLPSGRWYRSIGHGMGETLRIADEKQGYTLSDRSSVLKLTSRGRFDLRILVESDKRFLNPYHVILVNPKKHPHVNHKLAMRYAQFLLSSEGQRLIGAYRVGGERLFTPAASTSIEN
jgi:tungstate transport system substrate-binding protein